LKILAIFTAKKYGQEKAKYKDQTNGNEHFGNSRIGLVS
jgi:hypothetical protein